MYFYCKKSHKKIIHFKNCTHIQRAASEYVGAFDSLEDAYTQKYRLCRCCGVLAAQYRKESDALVPYGYELALSFFFNDRFIRIQATHSLWKIIPSADGTRMLLFHHNTFETKNDSKSPMKNYHLQRISSDTIRGYLEYIVAHDRYRIQHPVEHFHPGKYIPPRKGTKRYRKQQKALAYREKKRSIKQVLCLIEQLEGRRPAACAAS